MIEEALIMAIEKFKEIHNIQEYGWIYFPGKECPGAQNYFYFYKRSQWRGRNKHFISPMRLNIKDSFYFPFSKELGVALNTKTYKVYWKEGKWLTNQSLVGVRTISLNKFAKILDKI